MILNPVIAGSGIKLPTLTNPGAASDLLLGKELIGPDGEIVTGTMGSPGYNRKCTRLETIINAAGSFYFGDYYDVLDVMDTFNLCVAEVYDAAGTNVQAMLSLMVSDLDGETLYFSGTYINSSLSIEFSRKSSNLCVFSNRSLWWCLDPDGQLPGRKVRLWLYEML